MLIMEKEKVLVVLKYKTNCKRCVLREKIPYWPKHLWLAPAITHSIIEPKCKKKKFYFLAYECFN